MNACASPFRKEKRKMSSDWYLDVKDFHEKVIGDRFKDTPHIADKEHQMLRLELITEEICETIKSIYADDLVGIADGIADSIVVLLGTAITYGIDIRPVWDEVHKTNMAKIGGEKRADGKMLKPAGWKKPDIESILDSLTRVQPT
jgi:predicted HAD superfamily Cof-like phosphohydrolase